MIQRDYILRMLDTFAKVLAKALLLKEQKFFDDAEKELDHAGQLLFGKDYPIIKNFSEEDLIKLLTSENGFDRARCKALASVFKAEGELLESKGLTPSSRYRQALVLNIETVNQNPNDHGSVSDEISWLLNKVHQNEFSGSLNRRLFRYFEIIGRYDKAENILHELIITGDRDSRDAGILFYSRLMQVSDNKLLEGGLTREEITEAMNELVKDKNP
ncbi:hypothetical protein K1X84_00405 [bacterium]|nr:hypothetical protein [bacterium]